MQLTEGSIIAAGPVIIEDGKVLLNKEKSGDEISPWYFPGGIVEYNKESLEEACVREAKEELGIDIKIIKPLKTTLTKQASGSVAVLVHYLATRTGEIKPGDITVDWGWFDINNLPDGCAENVYEIIEDYKKSFIA